MEQKKSETRSATLLDLPEIAFDEILCRLPIIDAVRTSVLCRSWRHRWRSIPELSNLYSVPDDVILRIILLHQGPLRLFRARIANSPAVYDWIHALSRRSFSSLRTLDLSSNLYVQLHYLARFFPRLTHLQLCSSNLGTTPTGCFASLKILQLHGGRICGLVSELLSLCPELETLILTNVILDRPQRIDVVARNLRRLDLLNLSGILDFSITSAPALQVATLDCCVMGDGNLTKVFVEMPDVEKLELASSTLKFLRRGGVPQMLPTCFDRLRFISLCMDFCNEEELLLTLCLLKSAPNLQELELKETFQGPFEKVVRPGRAFWEAQESVCLFGKFETLKMSWMDIGCVEVVIDFIRFVFAKARVLKTTVISFCQDVQGKELLMKRLLELPMLSNGVRIIFK